MGEDVATQSLLPTMKDQSSATTFAAPVYAPRSTEEVQADLKAGARAHLLQKEIAQSKRNAARTTVPIVSPTTITQAKHVGDEQLLEAESKAGEGHSEDEESSEDEEKQDSDVEDSDQDIRQPRERKIGESRRRQNAIFESYIQEQARKAPLNPSSYDDEEQPITYLVKQAETQQIISSPREYQLELYERAKHENIIAVLDTGSGKTLIAVLLLRHIINQELEDRAIGKPKRISFFLVDSVALVFQQYAVLECNLDQPMARFCGEMDLDFSSKAFWQKQFSNNMVIVCTAAVLENCLLRNFISMDSINLLVFDEAHHAKKSHAYARIIKDFYAEVEDLPRRPRVFGMTASPVDARVDVYKAALELEGLLHCRIATASDLTLLQQAASLREDMLLFYDPTKASFETDLYKKLKPHLSSISVFDKALRQAKEASSELGSWCADQVWRTAFSVEEARKSVAKAERKLRDSNVADFDNVLAKTLAQIEEARLIVKDHLFTEPLPNLNLLSPKVLELVLYLKERFELTNNDRCIIFVKQRYTANLLSDLLTRENIGTTHLRVDKLMGTSPAETGDVKFSFRQQIVTLMRFRKGQVNCLIATSVAEEGIDIPDCNLIIRFDLYDTLIQYIQSRGRARQNNSRYIHMLERGNQAHSAIVREVKKSEGILRRFCDALPEDRRLSGNIYNMDYFLRKERKQRVFIDKKSNAKLTYRSSLVYLATFVSSLPQSEECTSQPEYLVTMRNKEFIGEVKLPDTSPIPGAVGLPYSTKQVARCSAAFEACLLLRKGKFLDEHFNSTFQKHLPIMRNAVLAVSEKKKEEYDMRIKPSLWTVDSIPHQLYLTVMMLENPDAIGRPSQPMGMLTRTVLPEVPCLQLFFSGNKETSAFCKTVALPFSVDEATMDKIDKVTHRVFGDIFSKRYIPDIAHTPYFLVPVKANTTMITMDAIPNAPDVIDWDAIDTITKSEWLQYDDNTPDEFFEDRLIIDYLEGSRKMFSLRVAHEYKPTDPVPADMPQWKGGRRKNITRSTIMEYSISMWKQSRARAKPFREDQRVIEAQQIALRRDMHIPLEAEEAVQKPSYVILEPLDLSTLPTTFVAMALNFPAIIHRIESLLIALDACNMLGLPEIRPALALEAMTKDSDNSEEHNELQIHFQRGMGKNYERLEFLGDAFLKMATSISIYTQHPEHDEYQYHVSRMVLICNLNLLNNALALGVQGYIRSQAFNRRVWYPQGLNLTKGKAQPPRSRHALGDKSIADVCEALIGAALLNHHETGNMDLAVRAVTALVRSADHVQTKWADYYPAYNMPAYQTATCTAAQLDVAQQVELKDAYHFKYPRLLRSAFTHGSYPFSYEHIPNYQRLEFLGDALFDMAAINYIFHKFPTRDPQWLTEHKMAMVSNQFLGALCVSLGFHKHMLSFSPVVRKQVQDYVEEITECRLEAEKDAINAGKRAEDCTPDYWVHAKAPPKCLPDMVEAYIGAIFVDSEYDYGQVERFFNDHVYWFFKDMSVYDTFANKHPTTFLTNFLTFSMGCSQWRLYAKELPFVPGDGLPRIHAGVMIHNQIVASAEAKSARYAKVAASKKALEMLNGLGRPEFRQSYRCDCKFVDPEEEGAEVVLDEDFVAATPV